MVRGPGTLLGGAETGLHSAALPGGSLLGSQQPGRASCPLNLPWSCPGKMGHGTLLLADQRTGRGSCHHPASCMASRGGAGLSPDHHLASGNLPSIHPRPLQGQRPAGSRLCTFSSPPAQAKLLFPSVCTHTGSRQLLLAAWGRASSPTLVNVGLCSRCEMVSRRGSNLHVPGH